MSQWSGLEYNLHEEFSAIELFAQCIEQAARDFTEQSKHPRQITLPSWRRIQAALPDILEHIKYAVEEDEKLAQQVGMRK